MLLYLFTFFYSISSENVVGKNDVFRCNPGGYTVTFTSHNELELESTEEEANMVANMNHAGELREEIDI